MNLSKEEKAVFLNEMQDYAKLFAKHIMNSKLPKDYYLNESDVIYELNLAFLRLAQTFKPKEDGRSLRSYCFKYGEKNALREILRMYRMIQHRLGTISIDDEDEEVHHQYGRCEFEPRKELSEVIDEADAIENLRRMADETDRRIISLLLLGYGEREIAHRIGISQPAVSKRMRRLLKRFNDWESKPLG